MAIKGNNGNGTENAASDTDATHHYGVNITLMSCECLQAVSPSYVPELHEEENIYTVQRSVRN